MSRRLLLYQSGRGRTMSNDTHVTDVRGLVHELTDLIYREVTVGIFAIDEDD